uniref:Uncharacterized protein n=1 Tax=Oryza brachyantha TaxID=4533 RepID=J3KZD0_ORYBR
MENFRRGHFSEGAPRPRLSSETRSVQAAFVPVAICLDEGGVVLHAPHNAGYSAPAAPSTSAEHVITGGGGSPPDHSLVTTRVAAHEDGWKGPPPQFVRVACFGEGVRLDVAEVWALLLNQKSSHLVAPATLVTFGMSSPDLDQQLALLGLATTRVVALETGRKGRLPQFLEEACREDWSDKVWAPPRKGSPLRAKQAGDVFVVDLPTTDGAPVRVLFVVPKMRNLEFNFNVGVDYCIASGRGRTLETIGVFPISITIKPEHEGRVLRVGLAEDGEHHTRVVFRSQPWLQGTKEDALMLPSGLSMRGIEVATAQRRGVRRLWFKVNQWLLSAILVCHSLWGNIQRWLFRAIVWPQPMQHSWLNVLGPPMKQIGDTCSISASALCIEAQFRKKYGLQFTIRRPHLELVRRCYGSLYMKSSPTISVINVIKVITETGGLTTTTGLILPITGNVPHRLENYYWSKKDVAKFIYEHGPVIAVLWVVTNEYAACTGNVIYHRCPERSRNKKDKNQGWHAVVCFGYRFTQSFDLHLSIMDSSSDDGPLRWLHYSSPDGLYVPEIGEPLQAVNQA